MPHALVLFPRETEAEEITSTLEEMKLKLGESKIDMDLVDSQTWFEASFSRYGSFDTWIYESVAGISYATRTHRFAGFFVVGSVVGSVTADLIRLALQYKRPVLLWDSSRFQLVTSVVTTLVDGDAVLTVV